MKNKSPLKSIIILALVVAAMFIIYFYFKGKPTDNLDTLVSSDSIDNSEALKEGENILILFRQLNSLKIDTSIFQNQVYKSLVDYTVIVPPQNIGKQNPFAEFVGAGFKTVKTTTTKTTR